MLKAGAYAAFITSLASLAPSATLATNPWDKYNFSPTSRTVSPVGVLTQSGAILRSLPEKNSHNNNNNKDHGGDNDDDSALPFPLTLSGAGAFVVLDFGKNVAGFTSVTFGNVSAGAVVGLAYSESSDYAFCPPQGQQPNATNTDCKLNGGQELAGDHSNGGGGPDGVLLTDPLSPGAQYSPPPNKMRGGFRYLNLFLHEVDGPVTIEDVKVNFSAAPQAGADPSQYANHFYSSDDLVNQIWYGCAYTVQLCSIDPNQGRQWGPPTSGWNNGALIGVGKSILVDGAKRDRTIWPGDMGVSSDSSFATTGDVDSSRQSLNTLYGYQDPSSGMLPYVGPEVFCQQPEGPLDQCPGGHGAWGSDTYHLWTLVGTANVYRYSSPADAHAWMQSGIWTGYQAGVNCSLNKVGSSGLMSVTATADWQRQDQGGENIAANALLAYILGNAAALATDLGDSALSTFYSEAQTNLTAAINSQLWDETAGAYIDNPTNTALHPQDGNSLAVWLNVTSPPERKTRILANLKNNWVSLGATSPEWKYGGKAAIGTFPGSMEVLAHLSAGATDDGLDLIKRQWGYMLQTNRSTQSTFWEGFQADGEFAFQGIYMSHAHGWSTGPGTALTFYVLGLRPLGATGKGFAQGGSNVRNKMYPEFVVAPQPSKELKWCNGSLALHGREYAATAKDATDGTVHVAWEVLNDHQFQLIVDTTRAVPGAIGHVGLPIALLFGDDVRLEDVRVAFTDQLAHSSYSDMQLPKGLVASETHWRDGRAWYELSHSARIQMEVELHH